MVSLPAGKGVRLSIAEERDIDIGYRAAEQAIADITGREGKAGS